MTFQDRAYSARRDPRALLNRPFITFVILFSLGGAGWMPTLSFLSVFIRDELGGSVLTAAMVFLGIHGVTSTLGLTSGLWISRFGSKSTYALGLAGMTTLLAALAWAPDFSIGHGRRSSDGTVYCISLDWASSVRYRIESTASPRSRQRHCELCDGAGAGHCRASISGGWRPVPDTALWESWRRRSSARRAY